MTTLEGCLFLHASRENTVLRWASWTSSPAATLFSATRCGNRGAMALTMLRRAAKRRPVRTPRFD
jgi:hypothetical protein